MGIWSNLFGRKAQAETRNADFGDLLSTSLILDGFGSATTGIAVTPETAMTASAVYGCVSRIARDIATLPVHVVDRKAGKVHDHPVARLLRAPNEYQTPATFWTTYVLNALLYGNGYARLEYDAASPTPTAVLPLMSRSTLPQRSAGYLNYRAGTATLRPDEVLHVAHLPIDGVLGRSPIGQGARTIGTSLSLAEFAARYFTNGSHLSDNAFELPMMSPDAIRETQRLIDERYKGLGNAHKMMAMPGLKVHSLRHSLRENQAIEARDFQLREVCRLFGMPVGIIDPEKSKYAGLEAQYAD